MVKLVNNKHYTNVKITASMLYNYMKCEHRVWRDIYGPQDEKIFESNPFVQLLWDKGVQHEEKIVARLGEYLNLSEGSIEERNKCAVSTKSGQDMVYS